MPLYPRPRIDGLREERSPLASSVGNSVPLMPLNAMKNLAQKIAHTARRTQSCLQFKRASGKRSSCTVKAVLSPPGAYLIFDLLEGGLNREGSLIERGRVNGKTDT